MKKVTIIRSNEPDVTTEYHLGPEEMEKIRKAIELIRVAPECQDDVAHDVFFDEIVEMAGELKDLEFVD